MFTQAIIVVDHNIDNKDSRFMVWAKDNLHRRTIMWSGSRYFVVHVRNEDDLKTLFVKLIGSDFNLDHDPDIGAKDITLSTKNKEWRKETFKLKY